ncbi:DNA methyltransferase [Pseudomonadota bacterium]|nr:DNA methyltransferase [Pseudomonadota bacterium]
MDLIIKTLANTSNPKSVHGIYPYRGKISSIDAKQIISQLNPDKIILDPFCGSGTILYEAANRGMKSFGIDLNPIAQIISEGKININPDLQFEHLSVVNIINKASKLKKVKLMPENARKHFHKDTANQIMRMLEFKKIFTPYGLACFYGSICLAARGCNHYKWTSSTVGKNIEPKRDINFYDKILGKIKKHFYPLPKKNKAKFFHMDTRKISKNIDVESIDYIFTSPPYFDCLDYTAYYGKIILNILEIKREPIRSSLIQNFSSYEKSMKHVLDELYKVMKDKGKIIFVVGDKKIHGKIINGAEFFNDISPFKNVKTIERKYTGSSSQIFDNINKTSRKEQIIVWEKK